MNRGSQIEEMKQQWEMKRNQQEEAVRGYQGALHEHKKFQEAEHFLLEQEKNNCAKLKAAVDEYQHMINDKERQ
jgi:hypothetical protein